jgi:hypothetical protein
MESRTLAASRQISRDPLTRATRRTIPRRIIAYPLAMLFAVACGTESGGKGPAVKTSAVPELATKDSPITAAPPAPPAPPVQRTRMDSVSFMAAIRAGERSTGWPSPNPRPGAVLPSKRIVAFYGNPLSVRMGVLGEYPVDDMLARLDVEVKRWREADPSMPVQPALHLIAVVAQGSPGRDGMYRLRMPDSLIERVYRWTKTGGRNALLFLDVQVAGSSLQAELPRLLPFLSRPDVHLGIDPEFSMHYDKQGLKPGVKIGTMKAADVNYAIRTLAELVRARQLPPKVLVVHRFTKRMLPDPRSIQLDSTVQVVLNMDGWGPPWLKFDSYRDYVVADPVEYTGFKLFFHNDTKKGDALITPRELIRLVPKPVYIQYQ